MFVASLARLRVPLGFLAGVAVWWFANPTPTSLAWGSAVAVAGEGVRIWAAGHLEKSREVTRSGPYRWMAHPLYVGSAILGVGLAIAASSWIAVLLIALYLITTLTAAARTENAFLRGQFAGQYQRYRRGEETPSVRRFSLERAMRNREYRAVVGLLVTIVLLAVKVIW